MSHEEFIATVDTCPEPELLELAGIAAQDLLDPNTHSLRDALKLPSIHRMAAVRHTYIGMLRRQARELLAKPKPISTPVFRTLEEQEAYAARRTDDIMNRILDPQNGDALRAKIYRSFLRRDY